MNTKNGSDSEMQSFGRFDGIIEGRRKDDELLEKCLKSINNVGLVHLEMEYDGGKFSLLADNSAIPDWRLSESRKEEFIRELSKFVTQMGPESNIESTFRCTITNNETAQETIFAIINNELKPFSRERAVTPEDLEHEKIIEEHSSLKDIMPRDKRLALLGVGLAIVIGVFFIWHLGIIQRISSPDADNVSIDNGLFATLIILEPESSWGNYKITITRGPQYPKTKQDLETLLKKTESMEVRAAINAVSNGETIYVRTENNKGKVIYEQTVSLRRLIIGQKEKIIIKLPGHMNTRKIFAALYPAKK